MPYNVYGDRVDQFTGRPLPVSHWWDNHTVVVSVAEWAVDQGELRDARDVVAFMEKPWHYNELHDGWVRASGEK
jgi:hypothetical protein